MAIPNATNRQSQVHHGISIWLVLEMVVCDHPNAPPASTMRNSTKVLANVPLAVMCATRVVGGGPPAASEFAERDRRRPARFVFLLDGLEPLLVQRRIRHRVLSPGRGPCRAVQVTGRSGVEELDLELADESGFRQELDRGDAIVDEGEVEHHPDLPAL